MNNRIEKFAQPHNGTAGGPDSGPILPDDPGQGIVQIQAAKTMQWIREHPAVSTGAALLLGVVVGWIIKRK